MLLPPGVALMLVPPEPPSAALSTPFGSPDEEASVPSPLTAAAPAGSDAVKDADAASAAEAAAAAAAVAM